MLVFAVLTDTSGITASDANVLVVHRPEHQLARACMHACACCVCSCAIARQLIHLLTCVLMLVIICATWLCAQPLFVVTFAAVTAEAYMKAITAASNMPPPRGLNAAALAAMMGLAGGLMAAPAPAPPVFIPFAGAPRFAAAPPAPAPAYAPSHALRRVGAPSSGAPAAQCGAACGARFSLRELCLARSTGRDGSSGVERPLLLFHLCCAAAAPWAAQLALQPLLREHHARPPAGDAPLSERELAAVYEELGSDEKRARRRQPG
jgi:hypothetical protein